MVKNTHGGSKHKSQARKASNTNNNLVIEPTSPLEKYAKVTKMYDSTLDFRRFGGAECGRFHRGRGK